MTEVESRSGRWSARREATDGMLAAAASALAALASLEDISAGVVLPRVAKLRAVTPRVAEAVVRQARQRGNRP